METSLQPHGEDKETITRLIRGILQDTLGLFSKELIAAKLEIKQEVTKALRSGVSLAIGGFILAVGFILLSLMFVSILAIYTPLPIWASLGIVALVYCIAGAMVLWTGKNRCAARNRMCAISPSGQPVASRLLKKPYRIAMQS